VRPPRFETLDPCFTSLVGAAWSVSPEALHSGQPLRGAADNTAGSRRRSSEQRDAQPAGEARSLPRPENELPLAGAYTAYGAFGEKSITPAKALQIADVWACVRVLADAASSLPLHVYRDASGGGGRERVRTGRLPDLLGRPAPATSQADLISSLMAHLAIYGSAYIAKYRRDGDLAELGLLLAALRLLDFKARSGCRPRAGSSPSPKADCCLRSRRS